MGLQLTEGKARKELIWPVPKERQVLLPKLPYTWTQELAPGQGQVHGYVNYAAAQSLALRGPPGLVQCSAVTILKFAILSGQGVLH